MKKLEIIFFTSESDVAFVLRDRFKTEMGFSVDSEETGRIVLNEPQNPGLEYKMKKDAAVVLVSDFATGDETWQNRVRSLPSEYRLIPAGGVVDVDYNDESVIPASLEELNFIRFDDHVFVNIVDAISTDEDFYELKNKLATSMNSWKMSQMDEEFLYPYKIKGLVNLYKITEIANKEKDEFFRNQLMEIAGYLAVSIKTGFKKTFSDLIYRKLPFLAFAFLIVSLARFILVSYPHLKPAIQLSKYIENEEMTGDYISPISATRYLEGLTNPIQKIYSTEDVFEKVQERLNENWANTPLPTNYEYSQKGVGLVSGDRYIWTGSEDGAVIKWDTYTGKMETKEFIGDKKVLSLALSEDEKEIYALFEDGKVAFGQVGGDYRFSEKTFSLNSANSIGMNLEGNNLFIWDDKKVLVFDKTNLSKNNEFIFPFTIKPYSSADIKNGEVIFTDKDNRIKIANLYDMEDVRSVPVGLSNPGAVAFVNSEVICCFDENRRVELYDIKRNICLGSILSFVNEPIRISSNGEAVVCEDENGLFCTENISKLLVQNEILGEEISEFTGNSYKTDLSFDNDEDVIKEAFIFNKYYVGLNLEGEDGEYTFFFDGGKRIETGQNQMDNEAFNDIKAGEYLFSRSSLINFNGAPCVLGVLEDVNTVVYGTDDGSFYEIYYNKRPVRKMVKKIPSRCKITKITLTDKGYYLTDKNGDIWFCDSYRNIFTAGDYENAVVEKNHMAIDEERE